MRRVTMVLRLGLFAAMVATFLWSCGEAEPEATTEGPLRVTWLGHNPRGFVNEQDTEVERYLEERFDLEIDLIQVDKYNFDAVNVHLAVHEPPDIMDGLTHEADGLLNLVNLGVVRPITREMIREHAPGIYAQIERYSPVKAWADVTVEGEIYAVPTINLAVAGGTAFAIRSDWVEAAGVTDPLEIDTIDEFEAMLIAMRDADPNGNGRMDEYPISIFTQNHKLNQTFMSVFGAYGLRPSDWTEEDGRLVYNHVHDHYREMLERLRSWYERGLIEREFVLDGRAEVQTKMLSDLVGGYEETSAWIQRGAQGPFSILAEQGVEPAFFPSLRGPYGEGGYGRNASFGRKLTFGINTSDEAVARLLSVMDEILTDPELYARVLWGVEGVDYTVDDDGVIQPIAERQTAEARAQDARQAFLMINWIADQNIPVRFNVDRLEAHRHLEENTVQMYETLINPPNPEIADRFFQVAEDLRPMEEEFFYKSIIGTVDIGAEWDDYVASWYASGGEQLTEWANEAHFR